MLQPPGLLAEHNIIVIPGPLFPILELDLEHRDDGWWGSVACFLDRSGVDCFHGPYPTKQSATLNAALWGRDMLISRGLRKMADALSAFFRLPNRRPSPGVKASREQQ